MAYVSVKFGAHVLPVKPVRQAWVPISEEELGRQWSAMTAKEGWQRGGWRSKAAGVPRSQIIDVATDTICAKVLALLARESLTCPRIAALTGNNRSTIHNRLGALEIAGLVVRRRSGDAYLWERVA